MSGNEVQWEELQVSKDLDGHVRKHELNAKKISTHHKAMQKAP